MVPGTFLKENAPWLAAGGLLTFGSSFGQTYFISIFAGEIRAEFGLSHATWGGMYAAGTLFSAFVMLNIGGIVDRHRTRTLASVNLMCLSVLCLAMALVPAAALLPLVIFGLRFCGQGMMAHIAIVSIGRWFAAGRGKASSVSWLGFSAGEAVLPILFVTLMGWAGWRAGWIVAAMLCCLLVPFVRLFLTAERHPQAHVEVMTGTGMLGRHWTRSEALRHWLFWACLPAILAHPIFGTAFFFQQVHMAEVKGWPLEAFAGLFPIYSAFSVISLIGGGAVVDRFGSARILPVYVLPGAVAFLVVGSDDSLISAGIAMACIGAMQGLSLATFGAFWPDFYGTRHLGSIRSVATAFMVFATALGPWGTGFLIDAGIGYDLQLRGMGLVMLCAAGVLFVAMIKARKLI